MWRSGAKRAGRPRKACSLFLAVAAGVAVFLALPAASNAAAARVVAGGREIPVLQQCDAEQYDCALEVTASTTIYWAWVDGQNHYRLHLQRDGARLERVVAGIPDRLASSTDRCFEANRPAEVVLRRRASALYVLLNHRILLDCLDSSLGPGLVAASDARVLRYQPVEQPSLSDDFMRTEKEQELGSWRRVRGEWQFHSVKETNPNADLRLSVNPFSLAGKDPAGALLTAGHLFWNDYTLSASVKSTSALGGLAFSYRAPDDYFLVRCDLRTPRPAPARVELVRVTPAGRKVLAAGLVRAASGEW
ncbi:MAG: hypothetical protein QHJ73_19755, partial [Armatimonadota bacterium]|nr:hypothetical protein [Armatimonadota bacterium]